MRGSIRVIVSPTFSTWCACHADDVRRRLDSWEQAILRRQIRQEAEAERRRRMARWMAQISPGLRRDILDWRVEA